MRHALPPERRSRRWIVAGVAVVLVFTLLTFGWVLLRAQLAVDSATQGKGGSAMDILIPRPLVGESTGRVNILLAGSSFDDAGHDGADLTDSLMVATMNLNTKKMALISIPRDLWVTYAGERMKINEVYTRGGWSGITSVVEKVTGLAIGQHVLVGYTALKDAVNSVGGVEIDIEGTDSRGIWDPNTGLRLKNGLQAINGDTALQLSRARNHPTPGEKPYGIADGDFGRARNQRAILGAILTKFKTTPALANPLTLVGIFDSISATARTDLSVSQVRRVLDLSTAAGGELKNCSIIGDSTHALIADYTGSSVSALVPVAGTFDYSQIKKFLGDYCL